MDIAKLWTNLEDEAERLSAEADIIEERITRIRDIQDRLDENLEWDDEETQVPDAIPVARPVSDAVLH